MEKSIKDNICKGRIRKTQMPIWYRELGYNAMILTSMLTGEVKDSGVMLASIGKEVFMFERPIEAPCEVIAGGENVVRIRVDDHGHGGPNQETGLSTGLEVAGLENIVISSIDTDGLDGSTDVAGGMVDASTLAIQET